MIMKKDYKYFLKELISIESISENEAKIIKYLEKTLEKYQGKIEKYGNTILWSPNIIDENKKNIGLFCHVDTVPFIANDWKITHPLKYKEIDGKIYGRGSCDMKCGGAIMLDLFENPEESNMKNWKYNVFMIFSDKEEIGAPNGMTYLIENNLMPKLDLGIIGEPTDGRINYGVLTSCDFTVKTLGRSIHSSKSYLGDNAIYKSLDAISKIKNIKTKKVHGTQEAISVNKIKGGIAKNIVPDRASFEVDYRVDPSLSPDDVKKNIPDLSPSFIEKISVTKGAITDPDNPIIKKLIKSSGDNNEYVAPFWSDIARLILHGIPAVNFGPGDINIAHTVDEYVEIEKIEHVKNILIKFLNENEY